ncbi:Dihydroxyacetone kinase [Trichinella pseudospiralis]
MLTLVLMLLLLPDITISQNSKCKNRAGAGDAEWVILYKGPAQNTAASLFRAEPFIYYNDIPESETAGMPDFKKLAEGKIPTMPPFTISRSIKLTGAGAVPVQIYSKSAKSRYDNIFTFDNAQLLQDAGILLERVIRCPALISYSKRVA